MTKRLKDVLNPGELYSHDQFKPTIILLLATILPVAHRTIGSIEFAHRRFPLMNDSEAVLYMFLSAFFLMGVLPAVFVLWIFRDRLSDYGLTLGDWRTGLFVTAFLLVLIGVVFVYPSSQIPEIRAFFPLDKGAGDSVFAFLKLQVFRGLFFYSAWEFFFRGFMLFGLRKYTGDWMAICIQVIPSCMWHIGMAAPEVFSSILAGLLFGILAIRTRSILWCFLLHYFIGVVLDIFIIM
jgi:membrane protease YdiL (CAAX protease family)